MCYDWWFIIKGGYLIKSVIEIPVLKTLAHWVLIIFLTLPESTAFSLPVSHQARHTLWLAWTAPRRALALRPVPSPGCSSSSTSARRRLARASRCGCQPWKSTARTRACRTCFLMCPQEVCRTASRLVSTCVRTPSVAHRSVTQHLDVKFYLFFLIKHSQSCLSCSYQVCRTCSENLSQNILIASLEYSSKTPPPLHVNKWDMSEPKGIVKNKFGFQLVIWCLIRMGSHITKTHRPSYFTVHGHNIHFKKWKWTFIAIVADW